MQNFFTQAWQDAAFRVLGVIGLAGLSVSYIWEVAVLAPLGAPVGRLVLDLLISLSALAYFWRAGKSFQRHSEHTVPALLAAGVGGLALTAELLQVSVPVVPAVLARLLGLVGLWVLIALQVPDRAPGTRA
ncbi:hypothetical protein GO986_12200 [Deinococcus sp. HMF7620]|uniref:Uncharacterized protein n=1 Tax=Deinococcus arboris TaxID=2682977 RepID=A0A7C9HSG4_9DEIO|nr:MULTISPECIES: hypothetical protein [Deinococcus]MBZ9752121.1 hypothetical protein [Deinococcus betulae]MVN87527.1 hypothetical protein [Deinococcus arboris]